MVCIPFIIAIFILIILVNINIKEGFTSNITTSTIESNINTIKNGLNFFQTNYLKDLNNNINTRLNKEYNNIYDTSTNQVSFSKYQNDYINQSPTLVINDNLELTIDISYATITQTNSYASLIQAIESCGYVKNNINGKLLTDPNDITEYKMVSVCSNILNGIKLSYDKFDTVIKESYSDVSGLNLLEYHQTIVEVIRHIQFQTPILFSVCIPYFNTGTTDYDLSSVQLDGANFAIIQDMIKTKYPSNYDTIINSYTRSFNDLIQNTL
jgi:hypothetical protein